jgi:signal transduction histidine kinase
MSIRNRLLLSLLSLWTVIWAAIAMVVVERSHHEVEELLDAELAQMAHVLRSIARNGDLQDMGSAGQVLEPIGHPYETKISFQLWDGQHLLAAFGAAPSARLAAQPGYSDQRIGAGEWRVFGLPCDEQEQILYVAQDYSIRRELVRYLTFNALQPILWSLPLAVLLIWLAVSDGLRSLSRLAHDVAARSDRRLEPVPADEVPMEVRPLVAALNGLMAQLRQTLSLERRFAADASHELRTPLAIIRTHAQIAQRMVDTPAAREALDHIAQGVERATRLVEQLLELSRLSYERARRESDRGSLLLAITDVAEDRRAAAQRKGIELDLSVPPDDIFTVGVPPAMLRVLLTNLVDNAIKFTPAGGQVSVTLDRTGEHVRLTVSDTGPGIPADARDRVFERFHRAPDQRAPGAGLGLSIVKRICELHRALIRLRDAAPDGQPQGMPGLRVEVLFDRLDSTTGAHDPTNAADAAV